LKNSGRLDVIEVPNFYSQGAALLNNLCCPHCRLSHIKKNGHTHYGKQNFQCLNCSRQFVAHSQRIDEQTKELVKRLLLERLSLRGICRVLDISLEWLLQFIAEVYDQLPDHLYAKASCPYQGIELLRLEAEADEMWSFVGKNQTSSGYG